MSKPYSIKRSHKTGEYYETMIIISRQTGQTIAEYQLTAGRERAEMTDMRQSINDHLDNNGTLGNYQW